MSWLRVVTYKVPDNEAGVQMVKDSVQSWVQQLQKQPGFGGGYWGESPDDGTVNAVMHWSSKQSIRDAKELLRGFQAQGAPYGFELLDVQDVEMVPVPATTMWSDDEEPHRRHRFGRRH